ncbi:MAG: YeiH family protein [Candidatus Kapaibacterium sp.]
MQTDQKNENRPQSNEPSDLPFMKSAGFRRFSFFALLLLCCLPFISPPIALAVGILFALLVGSPYAKQSGKWTKKLLQASVVGLGFGMNLGTVAEAGSSGFLFAAVTIVGTLLAGFALGRILRTQSNTSTLISCGTAICGGSAIAAVGPVIDASSDEMSVSLGTVFILNAVALFIFPAIGHFLSLSQGDFGIWSAIAIHDTSSVVGAASSYGTEALSIATTVKLTRALWIVPLVFFISLIQRERKGKITIPWFILLFVVASALRTWLGEYVSPEIFGGIVSVARQGMTLTLFLIGSSLSLATIKSLGFRPFLQGVLLWFVVSLLSLWGVLSF